MLYHASKVSGLRMLIPKESTHGKKYVYAIGNRLTAILFGAPKDDFDLLMDEADRKPVLYECYPHALKRVYEGKACSLYTVEEDGFLPHQTGWEPELVCEREVPVVHEEQIPNIYLEIAAASGRGECVLHTYSEDEAYRNFLRDELRERVRAFRLTKEQMDGDPRFVRYFYSLQRRFYLTESKIQIFNQEENTYEKNQKRLYGRRL